MTALQDCEARRTRFQSLEGLTVILELNLCLPVVRSYPR